MSRPVRSLVVAAVLLAALPAGARAAFPGRNGLLAVVQGDAPQTASSIVLLRSDGSVVRRIPHPSRFGDWHPAWSPDGRLLAFDAGVGAAERRLALVRADGTHRRLLPRPAPFVDAVAPAWSPDGARLAFTAVGFDVGGIWTVDRRGGALCRATVFGDLPSWSTRNLLAVGTGGVAVWTVRPDGTGARRLTTTRSDDPEWSPGGTRIAYTRFTHGREEVWTMTAAGTGKRRIAVGSMPAWSPDGRLIAFVRGRRIFVVPAHGGSPRKLAYTPTGAGGRPIRLAMPSWQPVPR